MAKVRNVIENDIKTTGANKAAKQVERVSKSSETLTRNQTRLGQSSASAGRSFSAQASGLGGLVGVYAAAAANVFAITAAFDALGRAAQAEQIIRGTKLLALEIGQNGSVILENVQKITQSQLTLAESAQNINIALSAGFNTSQIEQLSEVSLKASRALGRNLTDAFQRVVRGASKLEPELLDELGIFTRIDPAVEAYAAKLNIAANSLTNYEKRQAFVNAVIEEGQKKFTAIDTTVNSSQKTFEQLRVTLTELALEFGQLVANALAPIASFFKDNIGAALLLFGGILALVFGRALTTIVGFAGTSIQKFSAFSASLSQTALESSKNFDVITRGVTKLDEAIKNRKGLSEEGGRFNQQGVSRDTATGAAAARRGFREGGVGYKQQQKDIKILTKAQDELRASGKKNSAAFRDSDIIIKSYTKSQQGATFATRAFAGAAQFASVAAKGLALGLSILQASLGAIFAVISVAQLVGTLFDVDVLREIKNFFIDTSKRAAELQAGLAGGVSLAGGEELIKQLKRLGDTQEDLDKLPDRITDILSEYEDLLEGVGGTSTKVGQLVKQALGVRTLDQFKAVGEQTRRIAVLNELVTQEVLKGNDADLKKLAILRALEEAQERFGSSQQLAGGIADELGMNTETVLKNLEGLLNITDDKTFVDFAGGIDITNKQLRNLSDEERKAVTGLVLLENTLTKAETAFKRGSASSETLSKQLGGAVKTLEELKLADIALGGGGFGGAIDEQQKRVDLLNDQVRELKTIEQVGKALTDTYGKYGDVLDKAVQQGLVGIGGVAKDSAQQAANQAKFLATAAGFQGDNLDAIKEALAAQKSGAELDSIQLGLLTNRTRSMKAISGLTISLTQELDKEIKKREKIKQQLQSQLKILEAQNELAAMQNDLNLQKEQQKTAMELGKATVSINEKNLELIKQINANKQAEIDHERTLFNLESDRLKTKEKIADSQARQAFAAGDASRDAAISAQESKIADFQAFPNLRSIEQLQSEQRKLIQLEFEKKMEVINEQRKQADIDRNRELEAINRRKTILDQQREDGVRQYNNLIDIQSKQFALDNAKRDLELQKLSDDKANISSQKAIVEQQFKIATLQIAAEKAAFDLQNKEASRSIESLRTQQEVVNGLREALGGDSAFVQAINEFIKQQTGTGLGSAITEQTFGDISADFKTLEGLQGEIKGLQGSIIGAKGQGAAQTKEAALAKLAEEESRNARITELTKQRQVAEKAIIDAQNQAAKDEVTRTIEVIDTKLQNLEAEKELVNELHKEKLQGLDIEAAKAKEARDEALRDLDRQKATLGDLGSKVIGNINDGLGNAINTAFDNIAQGQSITQGLGDVLRGTFENIRKTVLEETLVKPLQEKIKSGLGGIFGMEEKGAENATVRGGALLVTSDDGSSPMEIAKDVSEKSNDVFSSIREGLGGLKEEGVSVFSELGGSLKDAFGSVMGSIGGALGTSGSGGGGIFGKIFGGISSMFGFGGQGALTGAGGFTDGGLFSGIASGGFVPSSNWQRLAAGGMARDRVPALLEPGEFVMKRSAANSIGGPALNQMNATGKAGGNVVVNIENQGTPQDATASEPRFDGEKFVIDIVTRDLRNNGPIRKSLRGGGAG